MKKLFIDELISNTKFGPEVRAELQQSRIFLLQNILPTISADVDPKQFPKLAPPYESCWFEWTTPLKKRDDAPPPDEFKDIFDERMLNILLNSEGEMRMGVNLTSWHGTDKTGWMLFLRSFMRMGNNSIVMLPYRYLIQIDADGLLPDGELNVQLNLREQPDEMTKVMIENDSGIQMGFVQPVLHSLALLNCKNIVAVERGGPPSSSTKRNRHHTWLHRHYVLQVRPMKEITKIEHDPQNDTASPELSYHFCRGHFKQYTTEKPLFGKYTGDFWWQSHARGSIKVGIVTKDYNVNPLENIET